MLRFYRSALTATAVVGLLLVLLAPFAPFAPSEVLARGLISPSLRTLQDGAPPLAATAITEISGRGAYLDVFLEGDLSEADLAACGVLINSRLPNGTMTAEVPIANLEQVVELPGITRITAAQRAKHCLNASTPATQATPNYWTSAPPTFTGQAGTGVIVGDVDSGIDWSHADFKKSDGTTRILNIWDQTVSGTPPSGYTYGEEWTQADINAGLPAKDADGHGTHVMGCAAGDGSATGNGQPANRFIGMAPGADIIMVRTDFSTTHIVDGVNYIFQRAAALGKSAVVNLSLGSAFGAHDGTETMDTSINALTGAGKIVVVAAGNEGGQSLHALQVVPVGGGNQTVTFSIPTYTANSSSGNDYVVIDAYYPSAASMSVSITSPRGTSNLGPVTKGNYAQVTGTSATDGAVYVENGYTPAPGGDVNIYIQIWDYAAARYPRVGTWTVTLTPVAGASPQLDLWHAGFQLGAAGVQPLFTSDVDDHDLVKSPGSAAQAITVGAYTTKTKWTSIDGYTYFFTDSTGVGARPSWSSPGPLRNGVQKPDISAPGTAIVSSLSTGASVAQALINPDGVHWTNAGTSMSCAHVTGGIALILADTPGLTPAQVKTKLYADAATDGYTGSVPNSQWGYGKLRMIRADTQAPAVTVTSPDGGETLNDGSVHQITWTATDNVGVTSIDITYSIDNGGSWLPVATGEANDGTFDWTVPDTPTTLALVRVVAHDAAANSGSDQSNANFTIDSVSGVPDGVADPRGLPAAVVLLPNCPSPFSEATEIEFGLPTAQAVSLKAYSVGGRLVATLADGTYGAGYHKIAWRGTDTDGRRVSAGVYFYRLETPARTLTQKTLVVRN
jgi:subtilisin family serine protease